MWTFGIASASYWWSRVAGAIGRIAQYIPGNSAQTWHLLVADDYMLNASGPAYREAIIHTRGRKQPEEIQSVGLASISFPNDSEVVVALVQLGG